MSENTMNENNVLRLTDITMQFGGVVAINNLSLDVNQGEIVALIGANGAGKSTFLRVLSGQLEAKKQPQPSEQRCFRDDILPQ